jgi:putative hydrolase of the HAD superfamily
LNIVFDLGGVLFNWEPVSLIEAYFPDQNEAAQFTKSIFEHPDWAALDRGTLSYKEAARRGAERSGLKEKTILGFLEAVRFSLTPNIECVELLKEVHSSGLPLYLLSNMHIPAADYLETFPFMNFFDGKIYSCRVHQVKPERDIYLTLLDKYCLIPEETVFIDDSLINLPEPSCIGIKTLHFKEVSECRKKLVSLGINLSQN